ncbi:MAG: TolB family protein, partial [Candidatus Acidiferrales bacterium]
LTHDMKQKLGPAFTPDNSRVDYGTFEPWETWEVPVLGGEPHILLPNSSSLTWIGNGKQLLFSEIKEGLHMAVVTTDEGRGNSRDVYVPAGERSMAHHSYLSPDGKWVLIVQMDSRGDLLPCRIVPFQSGGDVRMVGPPDRTCLAGAWSPDGKSIFLSAATDDFHIWRQSFPDGEPEQITFGPTSQEGIAMAPDGKSIVTSVGTQDSSVWIHDKDGDRQISAEGDTGAPLFSSDGSRLYFLLANGQTRNDELWMKDLASGNTDRLLPGYSMEEYSISRDGKQVAFTMGDPHGRSSLWIAPTNRRNSPVHLSSAAVEDVPMFLPSGDLVFRALEGASNFLYRMKADGSGRTKITSEPVLDVFSVSPDGRWVVASSPEPDQDLMAATKAYAVDGSSAVILCKGFCKIGWDVSGKFAFVYFQRQFDGSYVLPVLHDSGLPKVPPGGFASLNDIKNAKAVAVIPIFVNSALSPSVYAFTRRNTRRNLYRIQLP